MHDNQLFLIEHLCLYNALDYQSCLHILDPDEQKTPTERSYIFRPLTKNGYLKKRKDGTVAILAKGRELFPDVTPLISLGGPKTLDRVIKVSHMAMLLGEIGIPSFGEINDYKRLYFIPSARWRTIGRGILSSTLFLGMLVMPGDRRYAVYDIEDGKMEWQARAEGSLLYIKNGDRETRATGMIFVCSEEKRLSVAENIIRQTMWYRKQLLKHDRIERTKPTRWSSHPIKLKADYEHVYLTTPQRLRESIMRIYGEDAAGRVFCPDARRMSEPALGDYEDWPYRYFCNSACDLLKFVYFFAAVKKHTELLRNNPLISKEPYYRVCIRPEDRPILEMYPDVLEAEGLEVYEYTDR